MNSVSQYESTVWTSLVVPLAAAVYFFGKVFGALVDERDRLIAATAARNACYVLIAGLSMPIGHLGLQSLFRRGPGLTLDTLTTVVLLVLVLVVAEIGQMASRIFYYRRGP